MNRDDGAEGLVQRLGQVLVAHRIKLVTAESCTGGWIAKRITDVAGSSAWFEAGFVTYSNESKHMLLGVPQEIFEHEGAVSAVCVRAMASGALERAGGDVAIAVSGIAGPGGGSANKPAGTVWFAYARVGKAIEVECCRFSGNRDSVRRSAVDHALRGLFTRVGD